MNHIFLPGFVVFFCCVFVVLPNNLIPTLLELHALFLGKLVLTASWYNSKCMEGTMFHFEDTLHLHKKMIISK